MHMMVLSHPRTEGPVTTVREQPPDVHLNLNVRGLSQSATIAINDRSDALRAQGRRVFKLGLGQSPFPVPDPVVEELRNRAHEREYLPVTGLPALREAVAEYYRRRHELLRTPADVLVGPGSKELMFLLQLVYYGDLVIPAPSWVSYAPQAQIVGRQIHWIHTTRETGWRLTAADIDRVCIADPDRPRIVVLNYPSNPTGQTYDAESLERIAESARRYRVILLSDEIYGELDHSGAHESIAHFYPEGTIISSGLSKWCGAGGWRLGTFTFPPNLRWLLDAMAVAASETFTSTSTPIQHAGVRAFLGGAEIEEYLFHSRRILAALGGALATRLRACGVEVPDPQGAFYLFPDFNPLRERLAARGVSESVALCERLLEDAGVALLPGSEFGCSNEDLTARLAYVDFDGARALVAARAVRAAEPLGEAFLREHCAPVMEAVDVLCEWLEAEA